MQVFVVKALKHQPQIIKCSLIDHFVVRNPVPVVFFYGATIPSDLIIKALQKSLEDFPIFAGMLFQKSDQLFINCNNQGVQVKICQYATSLSQILSNIKSLKKSTFVDLINHSKVIKTNSPLLTIKLSYYLDGMAIGYCWHHSVGDMSTFMEFLKTVSAYGKDQKYDNPLIVSDREDYLKNWIANRIPQKESPPTDLKYINFIDMLNLIKHIFLPKRSVYLYFTHDEIENLRNSLNCEAQQTFSRNDVLCAYLLTLLANYRKDNSTNHNATIVVNVRPRIGMLKNVLGNYLGAVAVSFSKSSHASSIASHINSAVKNFLNTSFHFSELQEFVKKIGGAKRLKRIIPQAFLPQNKNLIISNWCNFEVYTIDFGVSTPYLFLPIGESPLPWVACIVEGFNNHGLLVTMILPSKLAKQLEWFSIQSLIPVASYDQ